MASLSGLVLTQSLPQWLDITGIILCYKYSLNSFMLICGYSCGNSLCFLFTGLMEMGA